MKLTNEGYRLSAGKVITPNDGIIGLTESNGFSIYEGYDARYVTEKNSECEEDIQLTNEELKEIAIYMSSSWLKYANTL